MRILKENNKYLFYIFNINIVIELFTENNF